MRLHIIGILASAAAVSLAACSDPTTPSSSRTPAPGFSVTSQGRSPLDVIEEDIAAGLLDRENGNRYRQYAVSDQSRLPSKYRTGGKGKDATWSLVQMARDWDQLSAATQEEILELQATGLANLKEVFLTNHFVLHYTTQGNDAVPPFDGNGNGLPDYIDAAAASLEHVWATEVSKLGYPSPVGTPAQRFHIYYKDLAYYGYTQPLTVVLTATSPVPLGTATSYIVIENDFYGFPPNDEDRTGRELVRSGALKVTQAHEFMHAIQFAINVYQSGWLMESHATWAEDVVYDGVNDWRWYVPSFLATPDYPLFSRYLYGAAFFLHWVTETNGVDAARQVWLAARTATTPDALRNVVFGGSWEGMKTFASAEYLLDLADYSEKTTSVIPTPRNRIRAVHSTYPVNVAVPASTNRLANRAPWGLGANFIEFVPAGSGTLTVSFDGADGFAWRLYTVATPAGGGPPVVREVPLDAGSRGSASIAGFGGHVAGVALVPTIADRAGAEVPFTYTATLESK